MTHTGMCDIYGCFCSEEEQLKHEVSELKLEIANLERSQEHITARLPEAKKRLEEIEHALANPIVETAEIVSFNA